jgi:enoyl-CoA hydratase/carnithine racemase
MNIRYELKGAVAIVTLDRPDKLNALTVEMREALGTHFEQAARDPAVRAVLLQASGKAFCASGDVSKMGDFTPASGRHLLKLAHRMVRNLANIEKPVVAAVRGAVAGIGWSMALATDMVIASDTAKFSQVFRNVGLVPDGGAIYFLTQHLGLFRAKELVYPGAASKPPGRSRSDLSIASFPTPSSTPSHGSRRKSSRADPRSRSASRRRCSSSCISPISRRCSMRKLGRRGSRS